MGLERHLGVLAARSDDVRAEGQVRHEASVHHVPLDAVDAGRFEGRHLVAEPCEVGRQD